jgi:hypothetical protein
MLITIYSSKCKLFENSGMVLSTNYIRMWFFQCCNYFLFSVQEDMIMCMGKLGLHGTFF